MSEPSYQHAVEVLQRRIGMRWEGMEGDGRREMADVLKDELEITSSQADELIEIMVRTGTLRYHRETANAVGDEPALGVPIVPGTTGAPASAGYAGTPAPLMIGPNGYWAIGREGSDAPGRKGQVDPTA